MHYNSIERTQITHAKIAGFLFLFLIATYLGGLVITAHIAGSGSIAESAQRIAASEHLYRFGLASQFITSLSTVMLTFTLYVALKPVDANLALLAMLWRLGESVVGGTLMVVTSSANLGVYKAVGRFPTEQLQALQGLMGGVYGAEIYFSLGSAIFFYLFFKSRYIPRLLSAFGIVASAVVTIIGFANYIFPQYAQVIQFGWIPILIAEIATGLWLLIAGIRIPPPVKVMIRAESPAQA